MNQFHIGRQPVFDRNMELFGYELLFRSGNLAFANVTDGSQATSQVMVNAFAEIGLENLVGTTNALINMPYEILSEPSLIAFSPDQVILEILEDVTVDQRIVDCVAQLKSRGFRFALDDFIYSPQWEPLIDAADIIKIDITQLSEGELIEHVALLKQRGKKILAERVENQDEYQALTDLQFDYFQGFFFAKPNVISGNRLPSSKINIVNVLAKLSSPSVDLDDISRMLSTDISLSMKILRFANAPSRGLSRPIESVQQAVVYLGLDTLKSWMMVMAMTGVEDKPTELLNLALLRARFCELIGQQLGDPRQTYFTVGLLSVLDAMLNCEMQTVLAPLKLPAEVSEAVLEQAGPLGEVLNWAIAMEDMNLPSLESDSITAEQVSDCYLQAMRWADETIRAAFVA